MGDEIFDGIYDILNGRIVGREMSHIWYDDKEEKTTYHGKVEKLLKKQGGTYRVGYWGDGQNYEEDAEDFDISKYTLAIDLINEDLVLS